MAAITHLDEQSFDRATAKAGGLVLIDYWAPWCAPCRALAPILEDLAADFPDELTIHKVDTQAQPALGKKMGVQAIPVLALYRDGKEMERVTGFRTRAELTHWIESHL